MNVDEAPTLLTSPAHDGKPFSYFYLSVIKIEFVWEASLAIRKNRRMLPFVIALIAYLRGFVLSRHLSLSEILYLNGINNFLPVK